MLPFLGFCAVLVDYSPSLLYFVAFPHFISPLLCCIADFHFLSSSYQVFHFPLCISFTVTCFLFFFFLERSARKPQLFAAQASSHTRYLKSKNIIVLEHIIPFLCKMPVLFTRKYLILVFHSTKSPLFIFSKVFESANLPCADFYTSV